MEGKVFNSFSLSQRISNIDVIMDILSVLILHTRSSVDESTIYCNEYVYSAIFTRTMMHLANLTDSEYVHPFSAYESSQLYEEAKRRRRVDVLMTKKQGYPMLQNRLQLMQERYPSEYKLVHKCFSIQNDRINQFAQVCNCESSSRNITSMQNKIKGVIDMSDKFCHIKDYPNIFKSTNKARRKDDPTLIVLHITDGSNVSGAMSVLFDSSRKASWNYIIPGKNDKEHGDSIYRCIPLNQVAWHVSMSCYDPIAKKKNINERSIGIETVNVQGGDPITDWQYIGIATAIYEAIQTFPSIKYLAPHSFFEPKKPYDTGSDISFDKLEKVLNQSGIPCKLVGKYFEIYSKNLSILPTDDVAHLPFYDEIKKASTRYDIPMNIIAGIIKQESDFNPKCTGRAGEYGLMQILPSTAAMLGLTKNQYDPTLNIDAGTKFIRDMYKQFPSWDLALAAYNWGPGNLKRNNMDYSKSKQVSAYVANVLKYAEGFKNVYF